MLEVFILALALSADAFAIALSLGTKKLIKPKTLALQTAFLFALLQALMPLLGVYFELQIKHFGYSHLIAFCLLFGIGVKMLFEAFSKKESFAKLSFFLLLSLAIASSIDALGAGFSLYLFKLSLFITLSLIALTTFFLSLVGFYLGSQSTQNYGQKAEFLAGGVLVLLSLKLLWAQFNLMLL